MNVGALTFHLRARIEELRAENARLRENLERAELALSDGFEYREPKRRPERYPQNR